MTNRFAGTVRKLMVTVRSAARELPDKIVRPVSFWQGPVLAEAIPFQEPIDQICAEEPPIFLRSTHYIVVGLFLTLLVLSAIVKVDIVVVGSGEISTASPPIMLQPMDRSIIRELKVKPGDTVVKGQVLAALDPTFAQADLASLTAQQRQFLAQLHRLEAEMAGQPLNMPAELGAEGSLQTTFYLQRQAQYASQIRMLDEEIGRRQANIRTTEDERAAHAKQLVVAKDIEGMRSAMYEKQIGSRLSYLDAQSARMRHEQAAEVAENRISEFKHDLQSKMAERQAFIDQWRNQVVEQLVATRTESMKIAENITKASLMSDLIVVTAPEDGVVLEVAQRSVGSVVREAEPLVTIVPSNAKMVVEAMIGSADVGYATPGDEVMVKVDAFPFQRHGALKGRLLSISEELFPVGASAGGQSVSTAAAGRAYHRGIVELTDTALENLPAGGRLFPGMTVSAEIKVGARSVMSSFLTPITRGFREAMREP